VTLTFDLLTVESRRHLNGQYLCQVWDVFDLPFQSYDDYNFSLTASLKSQFLRFWGVKGSNFKFNLSNRQKALPWLERRITTYWARGCVQRCDLWAWWRKEERTETFIRQIGYLPRSPIRRRSPLKFDMGGHPGSSYIFQILWKSVEGSRSCGGSKIALSHWLGPWFLQQLVLYRTSRD